jgi:hypothetical protein
MNKLITVASLNASKAWGGAARPSLPLKRSVMPETEEESIRNAVDAFVEDVDCVHKSSELAKAFIAGINWKGKKLLEAYEVMKKISALLPDGEAKDLAEEFLNT